MQDTLAGQLRRFLARTRASLQRLEALRFAAPWRRTSRCSGIRGPGQA